MEAALIDRVKQAHKLITDYRHHIAQWSPLERDRAWHKMTQSVRDMGFAHPDEVINADVGSVVFEEFKPRVVVTRNYEDSQIQEDVAAGRQPSTIFIILPRDPYVLLQKNFTEDAVARRRGITVLHNQVNETRDSRRIVCLNRGAINVVGHLDYRVLTEHFRESYFRTMAYETLKSLHVSNLTQRNNDVLFNGSKVSGCNIKWQCGHLLMAAFFISFNFDKAPFEHAFKDKLVYEKMPEINLGLSESQVVAAVKDQWEKLFGFSLGV